MKNEKQYPGIVDFCCVMLIAAIIVGIVSLGVYLGGNV